MGAWTSDLLKGCNPFISPHSVPSRWDYGGLFSPENVYDDFQASTSAFSIKQEQWERRRTSGGFELHSSVVMLSHIKAQSAVHWRYTWIHWRSGGGDNASLLSKWSPATTKFPATTTTTTGGGGGRQNACSNQRLRLPPHTQRRGGAGGGAVLSLCIAVIV